MRPWLVAVLLAVVLAACEGRAPDAAAPAVAPSSAPSASPTIAPPISAPIVPRPPLTLPPHPTHSPTPTVDPHAPTATPCSAEWCQVLGVQDAVDWGTSVPLPPSPLGYGIQIHGCGAGAQEYAVRLVADTGFDWIKQQVRWDEIEGVKGAYAWQCVDDVVRLARSAGLKVLLSVNASPTWARTAGGAPDAGAFANFAARVAQRYKGQVAAIEVYNEPNLAIEWGPRIDPVGYARMLAVTAPRIKGVDPSIRVISAGLAPTRWNDWGAAIDDLKYLRAIAGTIAASADCVGIHFNDGRASPLAAGSTFQQIVNDYRAITGSKPLCLTEFGIAAPLAGQTPPRGFEWSAGTTEGDMARWLAEGFVWAQRHPGVFNLIVVWNLNYYHDLNDPNSLYALQTPDGLRPAYQALKALRQ